MRVLFLDLRDFVQHVPVDDCKRDVVLPIPDVVLKVHRVCVGLDQYVVLSYSLVYLLALAAVDDQDYQIACQPLLNLLDLIVAEEVLGADVGMHVQFGNIVKVRCLAVLALPLPLIGLSHWRSLSFRILVNLKKEVHLFIGQLLNRLIFLIGLFLFEDRLKAIDIGFRLPRNYNLHSSLLDYHAILLSHRGL